MKWFGRMFFTGPNTLARACSEPVVSADFPIGTTSSGQRKASNRVRFGGRIDTVQACMKWMIHRRRAAGRTLAKADAYSNCAAMVLCHCPIDDAYLDQRRALVLARFGGRIDAAQACMKRTIHRRRAAGRTLAAIVWPSCRGRLEIMHTTAAPEQITCRSMF